MAFRPARYSSVGRAGHVRHHQVHRRRMALGHARALVEVRRHRQHQREGHRRQVLERLGADRGVDGLAARGDRGGDRQSFAGGRGWSGRCTKQADTWLPGSSSSSGVRVETGTAATRGRSGSSPLASQPVPQRAGQHREHHVVDVGARGVGHRLHPVEGELAQRHDPVAGDRAVERQARGGERRRQVGAGEAVDGHPHPQRGLRHLHDHGGDVEGQAGQVAGRPGQQPRHGRRLLLAHRRGRLVQRGGVVVGPLVEELGHQGQAADAVAQRVVHLQHQGLPARRQPVDQPELPHRGVAVEGPTGQVGAEPLEGGVGVVRGGASGPARGGGGRAARRSSRAGRCLRAR